MEKLYQLHDEAHFDLVVVDTPPTRHALDFLDAPGRLGRFLNNRIFRMLMMPTRAGLRAANMATRMFLRTVSRVVGSDVVADAVNFFTTFEGMEQGFRDRSARVVRLLGDPDTAFVVVAVPQRDAVEEAGFFADRLAESGMAIDAVVVNRAFPRFGHLRPDLPRPESDPARALVANFEDLARVADEEERYVSRLLERVPEASVAKVPFLADDIHDLEGLAEVGRHLFFSPASEVIR